MSKKVFKEVVIAMLLCIAIILVTALALYNYAPSNKELPDKVAYTTPDKVEEELADSTGGEAVVLTYEINGTDMSNYERTNSYNPGKTNPFEDFETEEEETETKTNTKSKTTSSTSTAKVKTTKTTSSAVTE